jgi:hypothetical protein
VNGSARGIPGAARRFLRWLKRDRPARVRRSQGPAIPGLLFGLSLALALSGARPARGVENDARDETTVDLSRLTLLPQVAAPKGVRPLRAGESDATVSGHRTSADTLVLTMQLGRLFTKGVKVYSEPSHTLLVVGMSREYSESAAGGELRRRSVTFVRGFPDVDARVELPAISAFDSAVLVYSIREGGDLLVAAAGLRDGRFDVSAVCGTCR